MTTRPRRIAVVTSGRQDYDLLVPLLRELVRDAGVDLQLLVTGTHLSTEFGDTVRYVEADRFPIAAKIRMPMSGDDAQSVVNGMAHVLTGFGEAFTKLQPDIVVVLGDRSETLAVAVAAVIHRIPIAHIHGGEATEGAVDDVMRHAITKMSLLHFPAAAIYRDRIVQMGEDPERVYCVGALALDNIATLDLPSRADLEADLGFSMQGPFFVVTFHPTTLDENSDDQFVELLAALESIAEARILFTRPNADAGGRTLNSMIDVFVARLGDRCRAVAALGQARYFGVLKHATAVVGNSSSGIIEAPWLGVPTINIGDRQRGRLAPQSVIHVPARRDAIRTAIERARDPGFRTMMAAQDNPYGDGHAAKDIADVLRTARYEPGALKKRFYAAVA